MRRFCALAASLALSISLLAALTQSASATAATVISTARVTIGSSFLAPSQLAGASEYDATNISSVGGFAHANEVQIAMGGGTAKKAFSLDLQAPTGANLHTGSYYGDDVYGVRGLAYAGYGTGSCQNLQFTVLDVAISGTSITRLDVDFASNCSTASSNGGRLFGELQLGEPVAAVTTGARQLAWPETPVGTRSPAAVPLWFRNTGASAVALGALTRTGSASDFPINADKCSHTTLAAHASCAITVGFTPHAAGARTSGLSLAAGATTVTTTLTGTGPAGRTLFSATSQPGDFVGGGHSYLITDAQSPMQVANTDRSIFSATVMNGSYGWTIKVATPDGGPFTLGTHPATRIGGNGAYSLVVDGEGRGCGDASGTVTVKQASFNADNAPVTFDLTFTQTCLPKTGGSLTGEVAYRATDATPSMSAPFLLHVGQGLAVGQSITNSDGASPNYRLSMKSSGQAVLAVDGGATLWSSPTSGANNRLAVRSDGTLAVLSSTGATLWKTPTAGSGSADLLVLQSDGDLALDNSAYQPVWTTGTQQSG